MARPRVAHDGFLIPNAGDVVNPKMAEPDQVDFNTVGNDRWGVIEGCLITVSGSTASTLGGTAVVNGVLVSVKNGSALLGVGAAQDRFDLVVTDENGTIKVIPGTPSTDPVFPDPPDDVTVLAVVFCQSGSASLVDNVIDKRNWLADSLLTRLDLTKPLIQNLNGDGDEFRVGGDGHTIWHGDAHLHRVAAETLEIIRHLIINGTLTVGEGIAAKSLTATEEITGSNLRNGNTMPPTGNVGDLFQHDTSGRIYAWTAANVWEELATISGAVPVGAIIQSMQSPDMMTPLGWVPLRGQTVQEEQYPALFSIPALVPYITLPGTMVLPDATRRVLVSDFTGAGKIGGSDSIVLSKDNLPPHDHGIAMQQGGAHGHAATLAQAGTHSHSNAYGSHTHAVADDGHSHHGASWGGDPVSVIAAVWGGRNKLDALFNDSSHTYNVEPASQIMKAAAGIQVQELNSNHIHYIASAGAHTHSSSLGAHTGHVHPMTVLPVGSGAPVTARAPYLTVYTYVRS